MSAFAWLLLSLALAVLPARAGAAEGQDDPAAGALGDARPSLLLVTLDTTRADRVGALRGGRPVTPTIDALAREGVVFERALSAAPITLPSHATILTGVYPSAHGVRDNGSFTLNPEAELISEVLARRGWRTGAFVGSYVLDPRFGLDQGFDRYGAPGIAGLGSVVYAERQAHVVVDDAIAWLGSLPADAPFFAWVHLFDPHQPLAPPKEWRARFEDPYDGEIAFADDQIGRLLRWIRGRSPERGLVVVVTADHGEALGGHGEETHGVFVYQETIAVPLVMSGPGIPSGVRATTPVSLAQIAPTLLDLAGLEREALPAVKVPSLLAPGGGLATPDEPPALYLESYSPYHSHRWHAYRGMLWGDRKLIRGRGTELYDLAKDPAERADLAAADEEQLARSEQRLDALLAEHPPLGWVDRRTLETGEQELLHALGYVEGSGDGDPFAPDLPDPRERIGDLPVMWQAMLHLGQWQALNRNPPASAWEEKSRKQAILEELAGDAEKLRAVLTANPDDLSVTGLLGGVEAARGNHEAAIPLLERAVAEYPEQASHRFNLATSYHQAGRVEEAVREIEGAIAEAPRLVGFYRWLATHYIEVGDNLRATWWLRAMTGAVEPGSDDAREVVQWIEMAYGDMRRRGQEPPDPSTLPVEEPGRK